MQMVQATKYKSTIYINFKDRFNLKIIANVPLNADLLCNLILLNYTIKIIILIILTHDFFN